MAEGRRVELLLVVIICLMGVVIGYLVLSPHPGNDVINSQPDSTSQPIKGPDNSTVQWFPTNDIVLTESHFRQDEPSVRVVAGFFKNTGKETLAGFDCVFNMTDPSGTEFYPVGYVVGGIQFLPNQTRDFEAMFTLNNNMTKVNFIECYAYT